jgi:hypothetical protein
MANVFSNIVKGIKDTGSWLDRYGTLSGTGQGASVIKDYQTPYLKSKLAGASPASTALTNKANGTGLINAKPQASYQGGQNMPAIGTPGYTQAQGLYNQSQARPVVTEPSTTSQETPLSETTKGLMNIGQKETPATQDIQGLRGIAQNQTPAVTEAQGLYKSIFNNPYMIGALSNSGMAQSVSAGAGQRFAQNYQAQLAGAGQNVTNALAGQGQQITAGQGAGTLGQTGQGQQISALTAAGGLSSPIAGPGGVLGTPQSVQPFTPGANTTFGGGQAQAQVGLGQSYTENQATLTAASGMTQDFTNQLRASGLNSGPAPVLNSVKQMVSANLSGPALQFQTQFQNIIAQYSKILGAQTVNSLLASSQDTSIEKFLQTLDKQAQQVQQGKKSAGTGQPSASITQAPSTGTLTWDNV